MDGWINNDDDNNDGLSIEVEPIIIPKNQMNERTSTPKQSKHER
jgi:hypothetical protein